MNSEQHTLVKFSACTLSATEIESDFISYLAMTIWSLGLVRDLLRDLKAGRGMRGVAEEDMRSRLQDAAKNLGRLEVCLQQVSYMAQCPSLEDALEAGRKKHCAVIENGLRWEKEKHYAKNAELV
ncbi:hypothetical protein [Allofournierella sp.]|uniref:hypothetical protein n=1 Tax=Allofournierella sp. TaxID=1940256 RepID=UPI003AF0E98B